ncbi:MAG: YdjY domain-containing protein [Deltaproteobacteria bacterium]|nr:YdjY domain-containing protein [Deltaproteobacteria bacterium]
MEKETAVVHAPGFSRRHFLRSLLIASGAVVVGPQGLLEAAANLTVDKDWPRDWPTRDNPLLVDNKKRVLSMYTELSLKHLTETTAHWGIGFSGGKYADKFILLSPLDHLSFHDGLMQMGAKPGNNLSVGDDGSYGKHVQGDRLTVTAQWAGLKAPVGISDIFHDSTGKGFDIRFGGNRAAAEKNKTGCLTCLESCPISITSNAIYPNISPIQRAVKPNSHFRGKPETLPNRDSVPIVVFYKL